MNDTFTGKVKFYDPNKGFGFLSRDQDKTDYFFHISECRNKIYDTDDPVRFKLGANSRGICAKEVEKINS